MKIQISNGMLMALVINMVYAKAIGFTQGIMAREVGGDIWIATTISTFKGVFIMGLGVWIIRRIPSKNIVQQTELLLGKLASKVVGILILIFFLGAFTTIMITYLHHLKYYFLPEVPILLFVILGVVIGIYGAYQGLEVIGRIAIIGVFSVFTLNILIMLGSYWEFDVQELLPLFQNGFLNTLNASRHNDTDWAIATMVVLIILPKVKEQREWMKSAVGGIIYGGISILLWPILEVGVLSPELTAQYSVSCMQLARTAEIGVIIHRYELIMVIFFILSSIIQIMISIYATSIITKEIFNFKNYHTAILPSSLVLGALSYWILFDTSRGMMFTSTFWPPIALSIGIGLPIILSIIHLLFGQKLHN